MYFQQRTMVLELVGVLKVVSASKRSVLIVATAMGYPATNSARYSSFHFLFHYPPYNPNITPI